MVNLIGLCNKDYKLADELQLEEAKKAEDFKQLDLTQTDETALGAEDITADIDASRILDLTNSVTPKSVEQILEQAAITGKEMDKKIDESENSNEIQLPNELNDMVKRYSIKEIFKTQASQIVIPQFYLKIPVLDLFGAEEEEILLDKENLLEDLELGKADINISFDSVTSELYKVDLDETKKDHTPTFLKIDGEVKDRVLAYILDPARKETRIKNLCARILELIGNMYPIDDSEIEKYVNRILVEFKDEQFKDFADHEYTYVRKIKEKINSLAAVAAEKTFKDFLDIDKIYIKPVYTLQPQITPSETAKDITKSLYEKEGDINGFEETVINEIANLTTILFWTRNDSRKGFCLNGFINHYPDFIIQTKSGKTILLETKGDDRDNSDSAMKIRLGSAWAHKAGSNFKYFMVFDKKEVSGAYKLDAFIKLMQQI